MIENHEPLRSRWVWSDPAPRTEVLPSEAACILKPGLVRVAHEDIETIGPSAVRRILGRIDCSSANVIASELIEASKTETYLIFAVHHLVADGWSMKRYGQTFSERYCGQSILHDQRAPTSSIEYARAQREWFATPEAQAQFEWWLDRLATLPRQDMPIRPCSRPSQVPGGGERQQVCLGRSVLDGLVEATRRRRCPVSSLLLAAFARTVAARIGGERVSVLSNVPGRTLRGAANATGAFYNTIVFSFSAGAAQSFDDLIANATRTVYDGMENQEVPISVVNLGLSRRFGLDFAARLPLTFNVIEHPLADFRLPGCIVRDVEASTFRIPEVGRTARPVARSLRESGLSVVVSLMLEEIRLCAEYQSGFYDRHDTREFLEEFAAVLSDHFSSPGREQIGAAMPEERDRLAVVSDWTKRSVSQV